MWFVKLAELERLAAGARDRRRRERRLQSRTRRPRAHPRAPSARPLRRHALHDGPPRGLLPSRDAAPERRTVVSAALCYYAEEPERQPGDGRLPRYTWFHAYAELREKLDALGRRLGGDYRVLVDENDHVDREGGRPVRRRLLRQEHDADHAPPRLVGRARHARHRRRDRALGAARRSTAARAGSASTLAPPARSTSPARWTRPAASPTGARRPAPIPEEYRAELGAQVYGCDICQDVCPWNRGIEKRRAGEPPPAGAEPHVSLVEWLEASDEELRTRYERLYFPRNDPRYLRRNALVAPGNLEAEEHRPAARGATPRATTRSCASMQSGPWRGSTTGVRPSPLRG